ncbi:exosome complex exonuclease Rrp41 [Candidatus Woesearchaeota archaeon]|nr:exosome complex exonuclease Rrp41 [Candidatus Woesearchaeota archaeon]
MAYKKRSDGRKFDELRPIEAKLGVIARADGSAYFKIGNTEAYAAVYGPRDLYPRFLQNPEKGVLRCSYGMMAFAGSGDRVRPGPSRRSTEISTVTQRALSPVIDLDEFPNAVVDVYIQLSQTDAGSRCAGICAASMALADAGIVMKDMVAAVAVGKIDKTMIVDLDYEEEAFEGEVADIPIAIIPSSGEYTLLQMDGRIEKEDLMKALELGKEVCKKIVKIQRETIRENFKRSEK